MYPEALNHLCCPDCPDSPLELEPQARTAPDGAVLHGRLRCRACATSYPIEHGIVDLLGPWALPDSPTQLINYLPPTAWGYERIWRGQALTLLTGEPFGFDRELPLITGLVAPARGGLYVDVACSTGLYARALDRGLGTSHGHVVGIDHAFPMLRQARAFAQRAQQRISFVRARAQGLPFAAEAVAGVAMGGSLNEIGDVDGSLREMRRVLTPTGRCVLMNIVQAEQKVGRALQNFLGTGGLAFWSLDELNRRLQASGLYLAAQWRYRVVVFSLLIPDRSLHSAV